MMTALPDYRVRHSPKSKSLRLKVTRDDGLLVIVPKGYDESKIPSIVRRKKVWIADSMKRVAETKRFMESAPRVHLPDVVRLVAIGETWTITYRGDAGHSGTRISVKDGQLVISGQELSRSAVVGKLKDWLRRKVRKSLFPLAERLSQKHRLQLHGLLVKSQRTRWASCSAKPNLSLNTKLLFLSPELVRYIMIHELCHTVHMNHSKDFWRLVASLEPGYKNLDNILRDAWKTVPQWAF